MQLLVTGLSEYIPGDQTFLQKTSAEVMKMKWRKKLQNTALRRLSTKCIWAANFRKLKHFVEITKWFEEAGNITDLSKVM